MLDKTAIMACTDTVKLFGPDPKSVRRHYLELISLWHPDRSKDVDALKVTEYINHLYEMAQSKIEAGLYGKAGTVLTLTESHGNKHNFSIRRSHQFELGHFHYGDEEIILIIDRKYAHSADNFLKVTRDIKYPNDEFKRVISPCMPVLKKLFVSEDDKIVIVLAKTEDVVLLSDLIEYYQREHKSFLPPTHAAWLTSRLLNLSSFMSVVGVASNGIHPANIWVSPKYHSVLFLTNWFYGRELGAKPAGVPLPHMVDIYKGCADKALFDLACSYYTVLACMGDASGQSLRFAKSVPLPMLDFLTAHSEDSVIAQYQSWQSDILPSSFGPRKFVEMPIDWPSFWSTP